jgi:hypothetical protein
MKGKINSKSKSTRVIKTRTNIPAENIMYVLMQCFTMDEAQGIINSINTSMKASYESNQFTIIKSLISNTYSIFVTDARYVKLAEATEYECEPPHTLRHSIADVKLWDGDRIGQTDADFIMQAGLYYKSNKKASLYKLIWDLALTVVLQAKQLSSKVKNEEDGEATTAGVKQFYEELNKYGPTDDVVVIEGRLVE